MRGRTDGGYCLVQEPAIAQLAHLAVRVPSFRMQDNNRASVELTFVPWRQAKATTTIQSRGGGAQQQAAAAAGDRAAWGQQLTAVSAWQAQTLNTKVSSV